MSKKNSDVVDALIADVHLQGKWIDQQLSDIKRFVLAKKVGRLRVAGDLFHFPEVGSPAMAASRMVRKVMALANELGIEWEVMAGNHDLHGNYSALEFLAEHPLIEMVEGITTHHCPRYSDETYKHYEVLVPWVTGGAAAAYEELVSAAARIRKDARTGKRRARVHIIGHGDLVGFSHEGGKIDESTSDFCLDPIRIREIFDEAVLVVSFGHIHRHEFRTDDDFSVGYIGAFGSTRFSECDVEGYALLLGRGGDGKKFGCSPVTTQATQLWAGSEEEAQGFEPREGVNYRLKIVGKRPAHLVDHPQIISCLTTPKPRPSTKKQIRLDPTLSLRDQLAQYANDELKVELHPDVKAQLAELLDLDKPTRVRAPRLHGLSLTNFGRHDRKVMKFSPYLNVLLGPSGSGKTTILDAITAGYYGELNGKGRTLTALVGKRCEIEFHLAKRIVTRRWPGEYFIDGEQIDQARFKDWIPRAIGPADNFTTLCLITQDRDDDLVSATPAPRLQRLYKTLGLEQVAEAYKKASKASNEGLSAVKEVQNKIAEVKRNLEAMDKVTSEEIQELAGAIEALKGGRKVLRAEWQEQVEGLKEHRQTADKYRREAAGKFSEMREYLGDEEDYKESRRVWKHKCANAGCKDDPLPCPFLANPPAKPERPEGFSAEEWEAAAEVRNADQFVEWARENKMYSKEGRIAWKKLQKSPEPPDTDEIDKEIEINVRELAQKERDRQNRSNMRRRLRELEDELQPLQAKLEILQTTAKILSPKGFPLWLVEANLPKANALLEKWGELASDEGLVCNIELACSDKEFSILTEIADNPSRDAKQLSGGERGVVRILVQLALALSAKVGMVCMDEPFANISQDYQQFCLRIMRRASEHVQLIVTSHEASLSAGADKTFNFEL